MKKNLHFILFIALLFSSCAVQKEIERADAINRQIQSLRQLNNDKVEDGTMSPEIGAQIDSSYQKMQTKINNKKEELNEARNKKDLVAIKRLRKELKAESVSYQRTIETFLDLYKSKATLKTFESSRFFAPGEYEIKPEDAALVLADMDPIIKNLNNKIESDPNLHIKVVRYGPDGCPFCVQRWRSSDR